MTEAQKKGKALLAKVVAFLNGAGKTKEQYIAAEALWDILTALRGPDSKDGCKLKRETTTRIRRDIGLKQDSSFDIADVAQDEDGPIIMADDQGHFRVHVARAVVALRAWGLLMEDDNDTRK